MSGALAAAGGGPAAASFQYSVVTAALPGSSFGYDSVSGGSISPSTLKGQSITNMQMISGLRNFAITINAGSLPQNFFSRILVQNSAGNYVSFNSSAASYTQGGANCIWVFGDGTAPVWNAAGLTRAVSIFV